MSNFIEKNIILMLNIASEESMAKSIVLTAALGRVVVGMFIDLDPNL